MPADKVQSERDLGCLREHWVTCSVLAGLIRLRMPPARLTPQARPSKCDPAGNKFVGKEIKGNKFLQLNVKAYELCGEGFTV